MENFKTPAEGQNPVFLKTPQDLRLAKTYRTLLKRIHRSEAEPLEWAYSEAERQWLAAMSEACDRQMFDLAYELAYYKRRLRSHHRRQRLEAEEFLFAQAEVLAEVDLEFEELFERHEQLQNELCDLSERHDREMHPVQAAIRGPWATMTQRLLQELKFILPTRSPRL